MESILQHILLLTLELKRKSVVQKITVLGYEYRVDFVRFVGVPTEKMIQFKCTHLLDSSVFYFYATEEYTRIFHAQLKKNVESLTEQMTGL